jgi:hypothetical protein
MAVDQYVDGIAKVRAAKLFDIHPGWTVFETHGVAVDLQRRERPAMIFHGAHQHRVAPTFRCQQ